MAERRRMYEINGIESSAYFDNFSFPLMVPDVPGAYCVGVEVSSQKKH